MRNRVEGVTTRWGRAVALQGFSRMATLTDAFGEQRHGENRAYSSGGSGSLGSAGARGNLEAPLSTSRSCGENCFL